MKMDPRGPDPNFMTRTEVAKYFGVSITTITRRENEIGVPILGPNGIIIYSKAQILSVNRKMFRTVGRPRVVHELPPPPPSELQNGKLTAQIFTLLDEGKHIVEVVKALEISAMTVSILFEQWQRMRQSIHLSVEAIQIIRDIPGFCSSAADGQAQTANEFIDDLHNTIHPEGATCARCHDAKARFCAKCAQIAYSNNGHGNGKPPSPPQSYAAEAFDEIQD